MDGKMGRLLEVGVRLDGYYSNGTWSTLDDPSGVQTSAQGINDAGQIVGSYTDSDGALAPTPATPGAQQRLTDLVSASSHAMQLFGSNFQGGDTLTFTPPKGSIASDAANLTFDLQAAKSTISSTTPALPALERGGQQPRRDGEFRATTRSPWSVVAEIQTPTYHTTIQPRAT